MKTRMIIITVCLLIGLAILLPISIITKSDVAETVTITIGITLYHFAMRLAVGAIVDLIMKNHANHNSIWFREKSFEKRLYDLLRVRRWKKHLPTYDPDTFDTRKKSVKEIIGATCQAEIVHEIIMVLSLLPIALIPFIDGAIALIATSVLAMLFDFLFVMLQRYNRPKLIRLMGRFDKLR